MIASTLFIACSLFHIITALPFSRPADNWLRVVLYGALCSFHARIDAGDSESVIVMTDVKPPTPTAVSLIVAFDSPAIASAIAVNAADRNQQFAAPTASPTSLMSFTPFDLSIVSDTATTSTTQLQLIAIATGLESRFILPDEETPTATLASPTFAASP